MHTHLEARAQSDTGHVGIANGEIAKIFHLQLLLSGCQLFPLVNFPDPASKCTGWGPFHDGLPAAVLLSALSKLKRFFSYSPGGLNVI